jgi:hypothetical protein
VVVVAAATTVATVVEAKASVDNPFGLVVVRFLAATTAGFVDVVVVIVAAGLVAADAFGVVTARDRGFFLPTTRRRGLNETDFRTGDVDTTAWGGRWLLLLPGGLRMSRIFCISLSMNLCGSSWTKVRVAAS